LFTENDTNNARLFDGDNATPFVKDAFHRYIVTGETGAVNPAQEGSKSAAHYRLQVAANSSCEIRLRLRREGQAGAMQPFADFDAVFAARVEEADEFSVVWMPPATAQDADRSRVMRQALAGMLWSKQYFYYDLNRWLDEHGAGNALPAERRRQVRNAERLHMFNDDIISMPDKWEYPWYAAWDLAFHMIPFAMVDDGFAKQQLDLMLRNDYLHPNGQIPAYEWNFGDVNPPVHAWATMQV
jgi:hypothetical protein